MDEARNTFLSGGGRHALEIDLPEDLPRVLADPGRVVQVLGNLLSNAARHSPEGSPICVAAGEGRLGGYGLGLAICKGLVEAHGGRIRAESDGAGRGTRVTFTLPAEESSGSAPHRPRQPPEGTERPCILPLG